MLHLQPLLQLKGVFNQKNDLNCAAEKNLRLSDNTAEKIIQPKAAKYPMPANNRMSINIRKPELVSCFSIHPN